MFALLEMVSAQTLAGILKNRLAATMGGKATGSFEMSLSTEPGRMTGVAHQVTKKKTSSRFTTLHSSLGPDGASDSSQWFYRLCPIPQSWRQC
jgi:hypothetical protein